MYLLMLKVTLMKQRRQQLQRTLQQTAQWRIWTTVPKHFAGKPSDHQVRPYNLLHHEFAQRCIMSLGTQLELVVRQH